MMEALSHCMLCPRRCGADRTRNETGLCGETDVVHAGLAWLHRWEEPCLTGPKGSGAVFFSGCSLGCVFCQNAAISRERQGIPVSQERLCDIFLELQEKGAANINLVTAAHFLPQTALALRDAKRRGLRIPVVYNSSGYENPDALRLLEGLVDVWLPDFKFMDPELAARYAHAPDYPAWAKAALAEMMRQNGGISELDEDGLMRRGVIVRVLLLPGHVADAKAVLSYLYDTYGNRIWISILNQYTPMPAVSGDPLLSRRVTKREYERLVRYATDLGVENGFIQEGAAAAESFVPAFDGSGIDAKEREPKHLLRLHRRNDRT